MRTVAGVSDLSRLFLYICSFCYPVPLEMFKILCYNDVCKQKRKRQIAMETIEEIRRHDRNL